MNTRTHVLNYSYVRLLIENFNILKVAQATTREYLRARARTVAYDIGAAQLSHQRQVLRPERATGRHEGEPHLNHGVSWVNETSM